MSTEENIHIKPVVHLAEHVTDRFPQSSGVVLDLDEDLQVETPPAPAGIEGLTKVDYVLAGSLSTVLLSQVDSFTKIDTSGPQGFYERETVSIPEDAKRLFAEFARPVGDLDYIPTKDYLTRKAKLKNKSDFLGSGGGSLLLKDMPPQVLAAVKVEDYQTIEGSSFHVDPLQSLLPDRVVRVSIEGKNYFLPSPDTMVAYKVLNMLESYPSADESKKLKFNADFPRLLNAISEMYSEDSLMETTDELLKAYDLAMKDVYRVYHGEEDPTLSNYRSGMPEMVARLLKEDGLCASARDFLEKLKKYDKETSSPLLEPSH